MKIPRFFFVLLLLEVAFITLLTSPVGAQNGSAVKVDVGVILDWDTISGKMRNACMSLALSDFYANRSHTTQIVVHFRDSKSDDVDAASAAIELLKNVEVQAILGPQASTRADFVTDIGKKVKVPVISSATSPAISPSQNPYFIRVAYCSFWQAKAIAAIVEAFGWRKVVFIYEDSIFGSGILPHLTDAMMEIGVSVPDRTVLSPSSDDDQIMVELLKLKTKQTRVFIVHLHPTFAPKFFSRVEEAGMMSSGYVWIITDAFTSTLVSKDPSVLDSLQGVIGVKPYVPSSVELKSFIGRWKSKAFRRQNPDMDGVEFNVFGLWAYDSVIALATALEKVGTSGLKFNRTISRENSTDLDAIGTSEFGPLLLESIRNIKLKGLSGDFHIVDGELQPSAFQIVNVIGREKGIGFWTEKYGISKNPNPNHTTVYSANKDDLGAIIWPGDSTVVPIGWEIPTGETKLRVGVPVKGGLEQLVKVTIDPQTNTTVATGFCVDVFEQVMKSMPYYVPVEYVEINQSQNHPDYDNFVNQVVSGKLDAVVGDITILSRRSNNVDFTISFTEPGVITVVPVQQDDKKSAWIFLKPMSKQLWMMTASFFVFIGTVIWVLEHQVNDEFQGPRHKQVGMIFWFSFSTLVFAHREKVISNLSRFVIIVWVFVVLVLTSSYTASLTSMLTVQQLQPTVTDVKDLIKNGEYVGCRDGSFVAGMLRNKFGNIKLRNYTTLEEFDEALTKGSGNGGVAAIVDELPYLRLFLGKYCGKYTIVGPTYKTAGFGFAFPRGSPLVPDVSRAILRVTESEAMIRILEKWFGVETYPLEKVGTSALKFNTRINREDSTDLDATGTSEFGPLLLESIQNIKHRGLSGDFHLVDGELQPSAFQIVNVIGREKGIGFWTEKYGISKNPNPDDTTVYSANKGDLGEIMWPGYSSAIPIGWEIPTGEKKIRVGIPFKVGFEQFVKVTIDNQTNTVKEVTGFCIEVFEKVMRSKSMPYSIPFEYIPCKVSSGGNISNYNDLVDEVFKGNLNAVVGDITILSNQSEHVDFTLPFTESLVTLVVPVKQDGAWIFMKPLEKELWMMIAVFILLIVTVIWVFEHRENPQFQGSIQRQLGMIFWFSISCPISPDKERVKSSLSRFVIIVWMLMVLVLISSYTASLSSMLTVHQLQPIVTDVNDLIKNEKYVGCQEGSFVAGKLIDIGFVSTRIRYYSTVEAYDEALRKGSENGGVDAIMDELPYLRLLLGKYGRKYTTVGPTYQTGGFGFAFPNGSPLVPNVSRAILRVTESDAMIRILEKWFGVETYRSLQDGSLNDPESLSLDRFEELFLIAGGAILLALIIFFVSFINENKAAILASDMTIWEKLSALAKAFVEKDSPMESQKPNEEGNQGVVSSPESVPELHCPPNPENADSPEQDAGSNTWEPRPPVHEACTVL
ncbi:PREDICTED: glutamate receptor 2.8-like isoform X2 [Ipomoea nil]|uniref:glutamate receptor 2.8-like isoform X2 n=1 Tax=Ipomoea nil TaxID=35883 RepID=UPI000901D89A|nr:PREDICTED: glutamate receptor 2.8-like isoform X2 [Ipomoea nil]